jgi:hypothetical protein
MARRKRPDQPGRSADQKQPAERAGRADTSDRRQRHGDQAQYDEDHAFGEVRTPMVQRHAFASVIATNPSNKIGGPPMIWIKAEKTPPRFRRGVFEPGSAILPVVRLVPRVA